MSNNINFIDFRPQYVMSKLMSRITYICIFLLSVGLNIHRFFEYETKVGLKKAGDAFIN